MDNDTCSITGCERPAIRRGWCNAHYLRWKRTGSTEGPAIRSYHTDPEASFAERTRPEGDCLVWTGARNSRGYGKLRTGGGVAMAHRYAWERGGKTIPEGMFLDHICWNKACVKIEHLRLASNAENIRYRPGVQSNNTSGYRGVSRSKDKWVAHVKKDGETHRIHGFLTREDAAEAAEKLRAELFGDFAGRG